MAVYIDIDALIDAQLYDDEHEEWNWQMMSVRDYLSLAFNRNYEKQKKDLELRKLTAEADLAEQQVIEAKLDNIEKMRTLQLKTAEECVTPLSNAAGKLDIQLTYYCSFCGQLTSFRTFFCPNCGADMRGDTDGVELR